MNMPISLKPFIYAGILHVNGFATRRRLQGLLHLQRPVSCAGSCVIHRGSATSKSEVQSRLALRETGSRIKKAGTSSRSRLPVFRQKWAMAATSLPAYKPYNEIVVMVEFVQ